MAKQKEINQWLKESGLTKEQVNMIMMWKYLDGLLCFHRTLTKGNRVIGVKQ